MKMLHKTIIFIFVSQLLYANSMLTQYRHTGELVIEKEMDLQLSQREYWDEYLKDVDTSLGFVESSDSLLICNKNKATLTLHKQAKNKTYHNVKQFHAYTGKKNGDKFKEGDLKTPHGIYNITKKISKVDSFYGPMAFVTSYPNVYDTFRKKTGSGIWIHGLPIKQERDEYTKGCIAINNDNIECLDRNIDYSSTVLIISPDSYKKNISKEIYSKLLSSLYLWRYSWIYNDTQKYLSFYSNDFVRHDGMRYKNFKKYKTRIFNKQEKKKIIFNNINIFPYPDTNDIFKITFREYYKSNSFKFEGNKVLIVQLDQNQNFKILTEK